MVVIRSTLTYSSRLWTMAAQIDNVICETTLDDEFDCMIRKTKYGIIHERL